MLWSCQKDNILDDAASINNKQSINNIDGHICLDKYPASFEGQVNRGAALTPYTWSPGQTIRVKFLNGDNFLQQKVIQYASEWMNYANIKFVFVSTNENADIKIDFYSSNTSWSYIGKLCQDVAQNFPSMGFGWFNADTSDLEFSRTIIHEFGHALGMIHEHQSRSINIPWDKPAVYAYFNYSQGWTREEVDNYVLSSFSPSHTNSGSYDRASIMHYFFPNGLTTDGSTFTQNNVLSPGDKSYIAQLYPYPAKSILKVNEVLYTNDYLLSPNGKYKCILQNDGNLVIYQDNLTAIWSTNTQRANVHRCVMNSSGNFFIYDTNNLIYWHTGSMASGASFLAMQDDGNLVVYSGNGVAVWSRMTGFITID